MKLLTAMRRATPMLPLVLLLMLANSSLAQDANTSTNLLDRYGNLDIERTGPTIDNELAQKMVRRGNTYSNLERYDDAIAWDLSHTQAYLNSAPSARSIEQPLMRKYNMADRRRSEAKGGFTFDVMPNVAVSAQGGVSENAGGRLS